MKKEYAIHYADVSGHDIKENIVEAAELFSRLSPIAQDAIIALVKSFVTQNNNK